MSTRRGRRGRLANTVRHTRERRGLAQQALAAQVGLSRQALFAIEGGTVPSAAVALRLAAALGCRVEDLFQLDEARTVDAVRTSAGAAGESGRAMLAAVDGRWVAHRLDPTRLDLPADAVARGRSGRLETVAALSAARRRLVLMGCAPPLGLLAARASSEHDLPTAWLHGTTEAALDALAKGWVHAAGIHVARGAGERNAAILSSRLPGRGWSLFTVTRWEEGLVVAPGNPKRLRALEDLRRREVRVVRRAPGAASEALLTPLLGPPGRRAPRAEGHLDVARAIHLGAADVGVAIGGAAAAFGLGFVPLCEERFDLVVPKGLCSDERVERLVDLLGGRALRREVERLGGYDVRTSGQPVGVVG